MIWGAWWDSRKISDTHTHTRTAFRKRSLCVCVWVCVSVCVVFVLIPGTCSTKRRRTSGTKHSPYTTSGFLDSRLLSEAWSKSQSHVIRCIVNTTCTLYDVGMSQCSNTQLQCDNMVFFYISCLFQTKCGGISILHINNLCFSITWQLPQ